MSTRKKTPVRIVCPHCRRAYVITVDLKRIYHTKPRAICSRCGGRFEVIQRMFEIDEDPSTVDVSLGARTKRIRRRGSLRRAAENRALENRDLEVPTQSPDDTNDEAVTRDLRPTAPTAQNDGFAMNELRQPVAAQPPTQPATPKKLREPEELPPSEGVRPIRVAWSDEKQKPESWLPKTFKVRETSPMPLATPSPFWNEDAPAKGPESVRAPMPTDLRGPMPWILRARVSLESLDTELPESAAALEWLLTERPSRPSGASPPPVPPDASKDSSLSPTPSEENNDEKGPRETP